MTWDATDHEKHLIVLGRAAMLLIRLISIFMMTLLTIFLLEVYYMVKYLRPLTDEPLTSSHPPTSGEKYHSRLAFLHIPKAGGSTIEYAGASVGLSWGICMFRDSSSCHPEESSDSSDNDKKEGDNDDKNATKIVYTDPLKSHFPIFRNKKDYYHSGIGIWHLPSQFIEQVPHMTINPYQNADIFAVVRNPYTKMLSEYYFYCSSTPKACDEGQLNNATYMNNFLRTRIRKQAACPTKGYNECYFLDHGHYISQYDYVYDNDGRQIVKYVLRSEHLNNDFAGLMRERGLKIDLVKYTTNRRNHRHTLQVSDLDSETVKLIRTHYTKDFELGGYSLEVSTPSH